MNEGEGIRTLVGTKPIGVIVIIGISLITPKPIPFGHSGISA